MKKKGLRTQIIRLLIIVALIPIIGLGVGTYFSVSNVLKNNIDSIIDVSMSRVTEGIKDVSNNGFESIEMFVNNPNLKTIKEAPASQELLEKTFDSFIKSHKDYTSIYFSTIDKKITIAPKANLPEDFDPTTRPWYVNAVKNDGQIIITEPYKDAVDGSRFTSTFAKTVKDDKGQLIGVVGIDINLDVLSKISKSISIGKNGYLIILDNKGDIISHKDSKFIGKTSKDLPWIKERMDSTSALTKVKINGESYLTYKEEDKAAGLMVVAVLPEKDVTTSINSAMQMILLVFLVAFLFIIVIGGIYAKNLSKPMYKVVDTLNKVKEGDFTVEVKEDKKDTKEIALIIVSVNNLIKDMRDILKNVIDTSDRLKSSSQSLFITTQESNSVGEEVARAVSQIAQGANDQSMKLEEGANVTNSLGEEVTKSMEKAKGMEQASIDVKDSTKEGMKVINNLKDAYEQNNLAIQKVAEKVETLAENSNQISTMTDAIKSITEQTNLLALNASIEAARAGEAGKGFAVVADEVRKLAEESGKSAASIVQVVNEIKLSINAVFEEIMNSMDLNGVTGENVEHTNEAFIKIQENIENLEENIKNVDDSLREIDNHKDNVIAKIEEVASVSQETAATSEEVSASTEQQSAGLQEIVSATEKLDELADSLKEIVNRFKF